MEDHVISTVQARITAEQERMAGLEEEISRLQNAHERAAGEVRRLLEFADTYYELTGQPRPANVERNVSIADTSPRRPKNPPRDLVAMNAISIIKSLGRPASRREIYDGLAGRGIVISGKDPEMVLSTMLWREQEQIVRLPHHGYWPKGEHYPPANYFVGLGDMLGVTATGPEGGVEADDID